MPLSGESDFETSLVFRRDGALMPHDSFPTSAFSAGFKPWSLEMNGDTNPDHRGEPRFKCFATALLVTLLMLTGCAQVARNDSLAKAVPPGGLLGEVREITRTEGLIAAREHLVDGLERLDASGGELEKRVVRTTRDPDLVLSDALAAMPLSDRRRTAIAIVPGTRAGSKAKGDRTVECLKGAAEMSREMGFSTYFLDTEARGTVEENADRVALQLSEVFEKSDRVILLMLSKGAHDVIRYLQEGGSSLPASHREKLAVVLSLAGTVQGSVVAEWMAYSSRPLAVTTRGFLRLSGQDEAIAMLRSVGTNPWHPRDMAEMPDRYPNLTWISIAMVPDGPDGRITEKLWAPYIRKRIEKTAPIYSPNDGLVETAASVLPESVALRQWVVPGMGSHAMPNGTYRNGVRIAPQTTEIGEEDLKPETGGEVISAYLRAMPRSLIE